MNKSKTQTITKGKVITSHAIDEKHPVAEIIGERIKYVRRIRNMNQRDLAEKIGVAFQNLSVWERGLGSPSARYICSLARILNVPTEFLLGLTDDTLLVQKGIQVDQEVISKEKTALELVSRLMNEKRTAENYMVTLITDRKKLENKIEQFKTMISTNAILLQATLDKYSCRLPDEDVKEIEEFLKQLVHFNP